MPINRDQEYLDISSASEDSADDEYNGGRTKKSKGKGIDRRTRDKGKGKANEVREVHGFTSNSICGLILLQQPYAWEASYTRSWDTVQEDESGSLQSAVEDLLARGRRRRYFIW